MKKPTLTRGYVIEQAENGLIQQMGGLPRVIEDQSDNDHSNAHKNLGEYLYNLIILGMNKFKSCKVQIEINITKAE